MLSKGSIPNNSKEEAITDFTMISDRIILFCSDSLALRIFTLFYNSVNILNAKESEQNNIIRSLIIVKYVIASSLELLGIEPLDSM